MPSEIGSQRKPGEVRSGLWVSFISGVKFVEWRRKSKYYLWRSWVNCFPCSLRRQFSLPAQYISGAGSWDPAPFAKEQSSRAGHSKGEQSYVCSNTSCSWWSHSPSKELEQRGSKLNHSLLNKKIHCGKKECSTLAVDGEWRTQSFCTTASYLVCKGVMNTGPSLVNNSQLALTRQENSCVSTGKFEKRSRRSQADEMENMPVAVLPAPKSVSLPGGIVVNFNFGQ